MKTSLVALFTSVLGAVTVVAGGFLDARVLSYAPFDIRNVTSGLGRRQSGCPSGWSTCQQEFCNPPQTVCCDDGIYCPQGETCVGGGHCCPIGSPKYCVGTKYCTQQDAICCTDNTGSCENGYACVPNGGCCPIGKTCSNCPVGEARCTPDGAGGSTSGTSAASGNTGTGTNGNSGAVVGNDNTGTNNNAGTNSNAGSGSTNNNSGVFAQAAAPGVLAVFGAVLIAAAA